MNTKIPKLSTLIESKKFDWVNSNITDTLFPAPKEIKNDFKVFHFNKYVSSEDAVKEMEKEGFRPANIYELLSWKDWNGEDTVVALGSVGRVGGDRNVPHLGRDGSRRYLALRWWANDGGAHCRFLGVRKSSLSNSDTHKNDTVALGNLEKRVSELERKLSEIGKIIK